MANKLSSIKDRVLLLTDYKGIAKEKFFKKIGMTYGNFKGKAKETPLNSNAIDNILTIIPEVNAEWLLTGKGEMLKKENTEKPNEKDNYIIELQKDKIKRLEEEIEELKKVVKSNDHRKSISTKSSELIKK